ncbi:MAG: MFS transporter [Acidimicrobiales bacterium]|nr:MFS transporter [Acidimicrobiales bacterium]RZV48845.1 MAG: MFS transporter [Acidimicrobiales bacterium]
MSDRRIFTGWKVVAASASLWGLQSMLWMQGFGNLAVELRKVFGWSKTFFSFVFVGTRASTAIFNPAVGSALAKWGTKRVMRVGGALTLVGYLALASVQTQVHFVIAMAIAALGMGLAGFIAITAALVQWFERKRARALSLQTMGMAIGGFAGPLLVVGFNQFGWRPTIVGAGFVLAIGTWLASRVIGLERKDTGEPVDGLAEPASEADRRAEGVSDNHFTVQQAFRTRAFWMISLGHASALLVVSATIAHIALYLTEDRGFTAQRAALIAGLIPVFQFVGTGLGGYLGDRVNKRAIVSVAMCAHALGLILMTWIESSITIGAFVVLHGVAWGARGPLMQAIRADYFGSSDFAKIMGWSSLIVTTGMMIGPVLAGVFADATGDYRVGFTIIAGMAFSGNIFWAFATPPPPLASEDVLVSATPKGV